MFKKKGVDVLDFTDMRRRGLLKETATEFGNEEVIDFSSNANAETNSQNDDFLSSLAGASGKSTIEESPGPITSRLRDARKRATRDSELNELRLKLDDNDFKLSSLVEKVKELERKLDEIR